MATSSTSVFSSSSTSSFASYNTSHHHSSSSAFQCSAATATTLSSSKMSSSEDHVNALDVPPALPAKRRQRANRLPSQYDNVDLADCGISPSLSLPGFMAFKQEGMWVHKHQHNLSFAWWFMFYFVIIITEKRFISAKRNEFTHLRRLALPVRR